jgi:hypothetical protein
LLDPDLLHLASDLLKLVFNSLQVCLQRANNAGALISLLFPMIDQAMACCSCKIAFGNFQVSFGELQRGKGGIGSRPSLLDKCVLSIR